MWDEPTARLGPGSHRSRVHSALPDTLQLADVDLSLFISGCLAPALQAVGASFSPELSPPKERGRCNNCQNLLLKFQCQAPKSRDLSKEEFSTPGCAAAGLTGGCSGARTQGGLHSLDWGRLLFLDVSWE